MVNRFLWFDRFVHCNTFSVVEIMVNSDVAAPYATCAS